MNRRVSKITAALLALTLMLSAPSAFAARSRGGDDPIGPVERIIRVVKKFVKGLVPVTLEDDTIITPTPPKP